MFKWIRGFVSGVLLSVSVSIIGVMGMLIHAAYSMDKDGKKRTKVDYSKYRHEEGSKE